MISVRIILSSHFPSHCDCIWQPLHVKFTWAVIKPGVTSFKMCDSEASSINSCSEVDSEDRKQLTVKPDTWIDIHEAAVDTTLLQFWSVHGEA